MSELRKANTDYPYFLTLTVADWIDVLTFYRQYDPAIGRFHGIDPLATKYSSLTPYNYALNDPVALNDPMGDDAIGDMMERMGRPRRGYSRMQYPEMQLHADGRGGGSYTGVPGSGYHWIDAYRSVEANLGLMTTNTFRSFYGLYNDDGSFNYSKAGQLARRGGLGTTFTGSFGVIGLTSGSTDINVIAEGDNYFYRLDGQFYGIGGGGGKGYAIQNPYTLEYKGFEYKTDNPDLSNFNLVAGTLGLIATSAEASPGSFRLTNGALNGSIVSPKYYASGWNGGGTAKIKTYNVSKVAGRVSLGANFITTGISYYQIADGQASTITYVDASVGTIGLGSSILSYFTTYSNPYIATGTAIYGAGRIGWDLGRAYGPSKWYGKNDSKWFE